LRPYTTAAGTLEVRGAFFNIFGGQLKILGADGGAYHATPGASICLQSRTPIHQTVRHSCGFVVPETTQVITKTPQRCYFLGNA